MKIFINHSPIPISGYFYSLDSNYKLAALPAGICEAEAADNHLAEL